VWFIIPPRRCHHLQSDQPCSGSTGRLGPVQRHVGEVTRYAACEEVLRRPRQTLSTRRLLPGSTLTMLRSSFIMSKLDYCNVALAGLPRCERYHLQSSHQRSRASYSGSPAIRPHPTTVDGYPLAADTTLHTSCVLM